MPFFRKATSRDGAAQIPLTFSDLSDMDCKLTLFYPSCCPFDILGGACERQESGEASSGNRPKDEPDVWTLNGPQSARLNFCKDDSCLWYMYKNETFSVFIQQISSPPSHQQQPHEQFSPFSSHPVLF
jgi:hypothetical protein